MPTATALRPCPIPAQTEAARPIRIAYVIDNLSRAGTETQLLALIKALDRTKFEPSLVLLDGGSAASRGLEPSDSEVVRLGVKKLLSVSAVQAARRVLRLWRRRRPDIVQTYFLDASYFSVPLARWCGVPNVLRVRNNLGYWLDARRRILNRVIRRGVQLSLTNSEAGRKALMRQDRLAAEQVISIENGVDLERFANLRPPRLTGPVRIGCVANLRPVKNVDGLLRAARLVLDRFPETIFEVAGEGEQEPELKRMIETHRLSGKFLLRGRVDDIPMFLGSVDVAVLPSHSESMSNALLEYMAAGRAIVATDVGANAKLVRHGSEGRIVEASNDGALAKGLIAAIQDPHASQQMGRAARRRVGADYSREVMRKKFEELYVRLAAGAR